MNRIQHRYPITKEVDVNETREGRQSYTELEADYQAEKSRMERCKDLLYQAFMSFSMNWAIDWGEIEEFLLELGYALPTDPVVEEE